TFNNITAKGNVTVEKDLTVNGSTTVKDITGENASFKDVNATNGTITNLNSTNGTITNLNSTNGTITNLNSTNGTITNLNSTNGTITNLNSTNGTITNLNSTNGTITNLNSTNITTNNITSTGTGTFNHLTATGNVIFGGGAGSSFTLRPNTKTDFGGNILSNIGDAKADADAVNLKVLKEKIDQLSSKLTDKGLKFTGNNGTTTQALGSTLNITGNATTDGDYSSENVKTLVSKDKVEIQFAQNPNFTNVNATSVNATNGTFTNVNATNINTTNLTATGEAVLSGNTTIGGNGKNFTVAGNTTVNFGNNKITGVAKGESDTDAVNVKQLNDLVNETKSASGFTLKANGQDGEKINADGTGIVNIAEGTNINVSRDGSTITVKTNDNVTFTTVNATDVNATNGTFTNVTANNGTITNLTSTNITTNNLTATGDTTIGGEGKNFTVVNGTKTDFGGNTLNNITSGTIENGNNQAVTGGAVHNAIENINNTLTGKGLTFSADSGNPTKRKLGETLKIAGGNGNGEYATTNVKTEVSEGTVTIKIAEDPTFNNITAKGNVTVEKDLTVNGTTTVKDITGENATFKNVNATESVTTNNLTATGDTTLGNTTIGGKDKTFTITNGTKTDFGGNTLNNITSGAIENGNNQAVTGGTVHNAIENVTKTLTDKGLSFATNDDGKVDKKLGETLTIKGNATTAGKYSSANIKTVANNGVVEVQIAENPEFNDIKAKGNVSVDKNLSVSGDTTLGNTTIGGVGNHLTVEQGTAVNMGGNTIHNIGEGYAPTDAVNKAQLDRVSENLDRTDRKLRAGIASASAAANIPQVTLPGKSLIGAGVANFSGESAVSIGYSGMTDNGRVIIKFNAGATTRGDHNIGGGIGYQW
ncbi:YadA-like family protein, partial [Moraxella marmotae]|uniref:YadA-like family protein n=1 Tax=Moraxella marmotae TaxID=3344520 RepID=UPI0035F4BBB5